MKRAAAAMCLTAVAAAAITLTTNNTHAARNCGYSWAVPGTYKVSGNFRGSTESATARLTNDCRAVLQIPGVFSGGPVRRSGGCLSFSFKVEGEPRVLIARWCNTYGIIPWQGRDIRATVTRLSREPAPTVQKRNFNN